MDLKFSQYEMESRLSAALEFGDLDDIAERIGKGNSLVSQMFNPDDERESNIYKAARDIAALLDISTTRGMRVLEIFNELVARHLPERANIADTSTETKKFNKELNEYYDAATCGLSLEKQIAELGDVERQAKNLRKSKERDLERTRREYEASNAVHFPTTRRRAA